MMQSKQRYRSIRTRAVSEKSDVWSYVISVLYLVRRARLSTESIVNIFLSLSLVWTAR